ncbi:MAG: sigma 54-interacting transcriptional regulator [Deltaproteobacteria bacterium]|jgi:arginine utilization regulatory protein|nr:sigma 54-interacting transcriptional regulator [Deltaproteobacteria bacterium]
MHTFGLENLIWGLGNANLLSQIFDDYDTGVIIMNVNSEVVYYNKAQGRIDNLEPLNVLGKTLLDLYRVSDNSSHPALSSIFSSKPLFNHPCLYYTHQGKLVNSIQNIFPIIKEENLVGCVIFVNEHWNSLDNFESLEKKGENGEPVVESSVNLCSGLTVGSIISEDRAMDSCVELLLNSLESRSPLMLHGEPGTGKELFARVTHNVSSRKNAPFFSVNCAAYPETIMEGILFGTEEGAFSGARSKPGLFELARGGTLYLKDVYSLSLNLQGKLLGAVEDSKIRRLGGRSEIDVSVKLISSTTIHPREAVTRSNFRPELTLKLGVVLTSLPPLRERKGDVPLLARHFINVLNERLKRKVAGLDAEVSAALEEHLWPGNVQELFYTLESAMNKISAQEKALQLPHFNSSLFSDVLKGASVFVNDCESGRLPKYEPVRSGIVLHRAAEVERIAAALEAAGGNAAKAARSLKISPQLMNYKLKKFSLKKKITVHVERVANSMDSKSQKCEKREKDNSDQAATPV